MLPPPKPKRKTSFFFASALLICIESFVSGNKNGAVAFALYGKQATSFVSFCRGRHPRRPEKHKIVAIRKNYGEIYVMMPNNIHMILLVLKTGRRGRRPLQMLKSPKPAKVGISTLTQVTGCLSKKQINFGFSNRIRGQGAVAGAFLHLQQPLL